MLVVETIARIRRAHFEQGKSLLARFNAARPDGTALAKVFSDAGLRTDQASPPRPRPSGRPGDASGRPSRVPAKNQPNPARPTRAPDTPARQAEPTTPQGISDARPPSPGGTGTGFRAPDQRIKEGELEALLGPLHPTKRK